MLTEVKKDRPRTPEDFFAAALSVLESDGFTSVTAVTLCHRLGVTRGSFYHHFCSLDDFVDRFLDFWEKRYTIEATQSVEDMVDEGAQFKQQLDLAERLPHRAEAAIRAWSLVDARVAAAQRRVDDFRISSVASFLRRHRLSAEDALLYAELAVSCLIGLQQLSPPADPKKVRRVLAEVQTQTRRLQGTRSKLRSS